MSNVTHPPSDDCAGQLNLLDVPVDDGAYRGVQQAAENAETGWWEAAWREVECLARTGLEFSAATIRERGIVGEADHSARWGALFGAARKAGLIEVVAVRPSTTKSRHGSLERVWRGVASNLKAAS